MINLQDIPHPSWSELTITIEVFVLLWPVKLVIDKLFKTILDAEGKEIRKRLLKMHIRIHKGRFSKCVDCEEATQSHRQRVNPLEAWHLNP